VDGYDALLARALDNARRRIWEECGHDLGTFLTMLNDYNTQLIRDGRPQAPHDAGKDVVELRPEDEFWPPDPLLDELDEIRQRIWDECDRDIEKYFAMILESQEKLRREGWKILSRPETEEEAAT
jgi:hypothetical protein